MRARSNLWNRLVAAATVFVAVLVAMPAPAGAEDGHTVSPGETLGGIAARYHTTIRALAEANGIDNPNRIVVGQVLVVPGAAAAPATVVHVVAPGETLAGIAARYGTSTGALAEANSITDPDLVRIGQRLTVPSGAASASGGGSAAATATPSSSIHVVAPGESLALIAARSGVTVAAIVAANSISNPNVIPVGLQLTIPAPTAAPTAAPGAATAYGRTGGSDGRTGVAGTHTVAPGETLASIARRYGVTVEQLAAANGILPPYDLYAGARLQLSAQNRLPGDISRCPVPGASFVNDWGFPRSGGRAHQGTDLMASRGTRILAPVTGVVSFVTGSIGGRQFRLLGDDGTTYLGSHMDSFGASGRVSAGDVVGYVGNSGNAAGGATHLHFEIHPDDGAAMNPYPVLRQACG